MAVDVTEIVGQGNMDPTKKQEVIALLRNLPTDATTKRYLYARWARLVNVVSTPEDLNAVAIWQQ